MTAQHLLVVSAGASKEYREYILQSIAQDYRITLLDHRDQHWPSVYIDTRIPFDVFAQDGIDAVVALHSRDPFDGVLCYDETRVLQAARLADALGLRSGGAGGVEACRDKHLTRLALDVAGVRQPSSVLATDLAVALEAAERIGYPVILKPRALMASEGVTVVYSGTELKDAYQRTAALTLEAGQDLQFSSVLVEEYVEGPEFSVDGAVIEGVYEPLFVAEKKLGFSPYFEEVAHLVDGLSPLVSAPEFRQLMSKVHRALGLRTTMTHVEFRMTGRGLSIIEVNARLGGDLIPRAGWFATGIDAASVAAAIAVGAAPSLSPTRAQTAMIRFCYPPGPMVVDHVTWPLFEGIVEAGALVGAGDEVDIPPKQFVIGRVAYAIAEGSDQEKVERVLARFSDGVQVLGGQRL